MQAVCLHSHSSRLERSHVMLGSLCTAVRPQDKTIYKADIIVCNIRENFYFVTYNGVSTLVIGSLALPPRLKCKN